MRIRKFVASSMAEALQAVKTELGESAVLLKSRALDRRADGRTGFEVTAALDPEPLSAPRRPREAPASPSATAKSEASGLSAPQVVGTLVSRGVDELLARRLAEAWQKKSRLIGPGALEKALAALVPTRSEFKTTSQPIVMAFVGPTGVGKTTTVAKLAAHFLLDKKLKVQLLTADTHRIAAVEQLGAYARLVGSELSVGYAPDELKQHRDTCRAQVLLVDTPGVGPMDDAGMEGVARMLEAVRPDQTHLCLSAAVRTADLRLAASRFARLRCDRILFTKLDESATAGQLLTALAETRLPVSYWTTGQLVPGDFQYATGEGMARLILGGFPNAEAVRAPFSA